MRHLFLLHKQFVRNMHALTVVYVMKLNSREYDRSKDDCKQDCHNIRHVGLPNGNVDEIDKNIKKIILVV